MTSKEALKEIEGIYEHEESTQRPYDDPIGKKSDYKEEFDILRKLVKRDTPMTPVKLKWKNTENYYYICPKCEEMVARDDEVFCQDCGQRLDWRKEKRRGG